MLRSYSVNRWLERLGKPRVTGLFRLVPCCMGRVSFNQVFRVVFNGAEHTFMSDGEQEHQTDLSFPFVTLNITNVVVSLL